MSPLHRSMVRRGAVLALLLLPGTASAAWMLPARDVAPGVGQPHVAVAGQTGARIAWLRADGVVQARALSTRGELGPVHDLSARGATAPQVAVDRAGTTLVAWTLGSVLQARRLPATGTPGTVIDVFSGGDRLTEARVAIDRGGDATFAWNASGLLQARRLSADGQLSAVHDLATGGELQVAADRAGNLYAAWTAAGAVHARRLGADGTLGATLTLSADGTRASQPQLGVDRAGRVRFAWLSLRDGRFVVQTRRLSAGVALGPIRDVSAGHPDADQPRVAVDGRGGAHVAWTHADGTRTSIRTRQLSAGGRLGPIVAVSPGDAASPQVVVDARGNARFSWVHLRDGVVWTRSRSAGGRLSPARALSAPGQGAGAPQLAAGASGPVAAVWPVATGTVQAAMFLSRR